MKKQEFLKLMSDVYDQIVKENKPEPEPKPTKNISSSMGGHDFDKLLTEREAAPLVGVQMQTLAKWRMQGNPDAPPFVKVGRSCRYKLSTLKAWIDRLEDTNCNK